MTRMNNGPIAFSGFMPERHGKALRVDGSAVRCIDGYRKDEYTDSDGCFASVSEEQEKAEQYQLANRLHTRKKRMLGFDRVQSLER